ncbi:hypothetical protein [Thiothrix eikelboomii]|uniref:Uncharacterized protein n=1 Tax=Thiothrix eikelboomii TaxID=92487 RepID=A0A1T4WR48_9GAMM|nr:hypothetical protein [Thiothrix eikelboomii]SKA79786.1 hypothetical protein SAMN02745130_02061 [Thiothrix eikelboomii]
MKQRPLAKQLVINPYRLFVYAQAFRFSSGRGRCFSPGFSALCVWQFLNLSHHLVDRGTIRWWRVRLGKG